MKDYVIAVDVGSGFVKAALGYRAPQGIHLMSVVEEKSVGIERGLITDGPRASETIKRAIEKLYDKTDVEKFEYLTVIAGIAGKAIFSSNNVEGMISLRENKPIDEKDVEKVLEQAKTMANIPNDHEIVYIHPHIFIVDKPETGTVKNPIGMHGKSLKVRAYIISIDSSVLRNYKSVFHNADIDDVNFYFNPIVESYGILLPEDRGEGSILIDMGKDLTLMTIWSRDSIYYTSVLEKGVSQLITREFARGLGITRDMAEELTRKFYITEGDFYQQEETIEVLDRRTNTKRTFNANLVSNIARSSLEPFFREIRGKLEELDVYSKLDQVQVYLTGGGALINGLEMYAEDIMEIPVSRGELRISVIDEAYNNPRYGVLAGLIKYYFEAPYTIYTPRTRKGKGLMEILKEKFREMF